MTAGIARAVSVALLAEVLLVIGQPSPYPVIFAGQVAASAFLAGVLAVSVRRMRHRPGGEQEDGTAPPDAGPS
jgi:hypothetical protein